MEIVQNSIDYDYATHKVYQEGVSTPLDESADIDDRDGTIDYGEMVKESVFLGKMPFDEILDGIKRQFEDYINTEDENNYVDIFYTQMNDSIRALENDQEEEHPQEIRDVLDKLKSEFISLISHLFETRLTISILAVDDESTEEDEQEYVIRKMYEYFILDAKENFTSVITKGIISQLGNINDDMLDQRVDQLLCGYDPLVNCITPTEFLELTGRDDIIDLYDDIQVSGNFLRKYSAKLYQNDDFKIDIINNIAIVRNVKEDIVNAEQ